jgi:hypothetical protein
MRRQARDKNISIHLVDKGNEAQLELLVGQKINPE